MKANELRIGNLIYGIPLKDETTFEFLEHPIIQIKNLSGMGNIEIGISIDECLNEENENRFYQPIQITEEWLIRFGWGKGEYDTEYCDNVSLDQYALSYTVYANMFCIEANSDIIEIPNIKYVHQLQNIYFALTGKELTLIN